MKDHRLKRKKRKMGHVLGSCRRTKNHVDHDVITFAVGSLGMAPKGLETVVKELKSSERIMSIHTTA